MYNIDLKNTLDSEITVGPMFINFDFFPGVTALLKAIKGPMFIKLSIKSWKKHFSDF